VLDLELAHLVDAGLGRPALQRGLGGLLQDALGHPRWHVGQLHHSPRLEAAYKEKRRKRAETQRRVEEAGEQTDAADARRGEKAAIPGIASLGGEEPMRVYAFAGDGADDTAAAVAKLFGRAARRERLYVLAVDACGGALAEKLSTTNGEDATIPPDAFLRRGEADPERLGDHVASTRLSALKVVGSPRNGSLPASPLQEAASEVFDLCVVACGDTQSAYAEDWLLEADEVVACSSEGACKALDAALLAEEKRDTNGTILAVMGTDGAQPPEAARLKSEEDEARPLYSLGPGAGSGTQSDKGLRDLTRALAGSTNRSTTTDAIGTREEGANV